MYKHKCNNWDFKTGMKNKYAVSLTLLVHTTDDFRVQVSSASQMSYHVAQHIQMIISSKVWVFLHHNCHTMQHKTNLGFLCHKCHTMWHKTNPGHSTKISGHFLFLI